MNSLILVTGATGYVGDDSGAGSHRKVAGCAASGGAHIAGRSDH